MDITQPLSACSVLQHTNSLHSSRVFQYCNLCLLPLAFHCAHLRRVSFPHFYKPFWLLKTAMQSSQSPLFFRISLEIDHKLKSLHTAYFISLILITEVSQLVHAAWRKRGQKVKTMPYQPKLWALVAPRKPFKTSVSDVLCLNIISINFN